MWAVRFNKFITSVGYLTARENEVELLTTKFYNLHIVSVETFRHFVKQNFVTVKLKVFESNGVKFCISSSPFIIVFCLFFFLSHCYASTHAW